LLTNATAKNIGLSKFEIDHEKSGLRVMTYASDGVATEPKLADWEPLSAWPVFEAHGLLEPGEPAAEELLIEFPTGASPPSSSSSGSPPPKTSRGR